jgi:DNA polymerase elongation subunit (family B)
MDYVTLDIETVPLPEVYDPKDPNVLDYLMSKETSRIMGFHPVFSKIIVVGIKEPDDEPIIYDGDDERRILSDVWDYFDDHRGVKIVTFNGYGFDVPFIKVRSFINEIQPTIDINTNKWMMEGSNHFDCMLAFSHKDTFLWVSLEILCRLHGIEVPEDKIESREVMAYYRSGDWESIRQHKNPSDSIIYRI